MYKKSHKLEKKYIILIILLLITIFLGFAIKIVKDNRKLSPLEKLIKDSVLFTSKVVYLPINFVTNGISRIKEQNNMYEKYKELEKNANEVDKISAKNDELNREIKQMKELLELNHTLDADSYLNATVINRNLDFFNNIITIDKGENNGVKKDMAVIVSKGLVGRVVKTSNFNSTIKMITSSDMNNKISVKIKLTNKYIYGLLTNKNKKLLIEGIDTNDEIPLNAIVTTTGLGGIFPSGVLVGKVKSITKDNFDLASAVEIESLVDFDDISFVTILKRPK